jgi:hypothetical protein
LPVFSESPPSGGRVDHSTLRFLSAPHLGGDSEKTNFELRASVIARAGARRRRERRRPFLCERRRRRRILDVRAADLRRRRRNTPFRFGISDEDGGNPANIAASEASNSIPRNARAAL